MIKQTSYKIITVIVLIVFIAVSTGFSFYIHKCVCEQRIVASLFVEHKCHEEQVSSCCSVKEAIETNYSDADASCGCKTEHFTIKVNEHFNSTNPTVINQEFDFAAACLYLYQANISNHSRGFNTDTNLYIPDDSPPIKPVGRILIYLLHQSKTPALLS